MMNPFPEDSYHTPADMPRYWASRLFFNSRWALHIPFIKIVFVSRKLAVQGLYDDTAWFNASYQSLRIVEKCGGRFHIEGMDNIRKWPGEPQVIVSNHMSTMETAIFPCLVVPIKPMTYVVKESLVKQFIFGPVMRSRDPIVVTRKNPREDLVRVLTEGEKILKNGRSLVIFPQSTRYDDFDPATFNTLGIKLAKRAGVRILPVAIKTDFWGNSKINSIKDLGPLSLNKPIHFKFGEPMEIKGSGREEHRQIVDFIAANIEKWKKEDKE